MTDVLIADADETPHLGMSVAARLVREGAEPTPATSDRSRR